MRHLLLSCLLGLLLVGCSAAKATPLSDLTGMIPLPVEEQTAYDDWCQETYGPDQSAVGLRNGIAQCQKDATVPRVPVEKLLDFKLNETHLFILQEFYNNQWTQAVQPEQQAELNAFCLDVIGPDRRAVALTPRGPLCSFDPIAPETMGPEAYERTRREIESFCPKLGFPEAKFDPKTQILTCRLPQV